jgi:hypothetical protein
MRKLTMFLGFALAACLSCFSMSALAQPVAYAYRSAVALAELPGVALRRMELTLVMWRTGSSPSEDSLKSNLRASSNHFVMASTKPEPDGIGVGAGLSYC